ncbi:MAG: toll/interleukin-1 receptor domain-containing protein [Oscillospiraceae bacterium]|nr:toll/interleukin-1 receptor domain-containing protein [Oscillospiraceae bacterium]
MNKTNAPHIETYRGEDQYIFISYCHKDSSTVLPILETLIQRGYRIWYDEGIDPCSEWDATIAHQLMNCSFFIPFISNNYLASENCMDELHLAREKSIKRFLVYLEEIDLPPALEMRLGRIQNIHKYKYTSEAEFYDKFARADGLDGCLDKTGTISLDEDFEESNLFTDDRTKSDELTTDVLELDLSRKIVDLKDSTISQTSFESSHNENYAASLILTPGTLVNHKTLGTGTITDVQPDFISVSFPDGEKNMVVPYAFEAGILSLVTEPQTDKHEFSKSNNFSSATKFLARITLAILIFTVVFALFFLIEHGFPQ